MSTPVLMPQMGLEVSEATVLAVLVAPGDRVSEGQPLLEIETEKAVAEVVAPCDGFIVSLAVTEGDTVQVGVAAAQIGDTADAVAGEDAGGDDVAPAAMVDASASVQVAAEPHAPATMVRAAPVARRAAAALGIDVTAIVGTGPRGRVTLRDVEQASEAGEGGVTNADDATVQNGAQRADGAPPTDRPPGDDPLEPMSKVRRIVARRMTQSQLIPQYHLERDVDVTHLLAQKSAAAAGATGPRPGVNDLLVQAIAQTLVEHPALAMTYVDGPEPALRRHPRVGVGLAVAADHGLVVPVIPRADTLGLGEIAAHRVRLVDAARAGRLKPTEMSGAAVTLSNLGGAGVDRFAAMLNPGESAIVAVGRVTERVVPRGRAITVMPTLTVTMTFDHRTVDGAVGADALAGLASLLEGRMTWRP